jgi:hypothetical protein
MISLETAIAASAAAIAMKAVRRNPSRVDAAYDALNAARAAARSDHAQDEHAAIAACAEARAYARVACAGMPEFESELDGLASIIEAAVWVSDSASVQAADA